MDLMNELTKAKADEKAEMDEVLDCVGDDCDFNIDLDNGNIEDVKSIFFQSERIKKANKEDSDRIWNEFCDRNYSLTQIDLINDKVKCDEYEDVYKEDYQKMCKKNIEYNRTKPVVTCSMGNFLKGE